MKTTNESEQRTVVGITPDQVRAFETTYEFLWHEQRESDLTRHRPDVQAAIKAIGLFLYGGDEDSLKSIHVLFAHSLSTNPNQIGGRYE